MLATSVAAVVTATVRPQFAKADELSFSDFSSTAGLTLNGDATAANSLFASGATLDGNVLRVAPSLVGQAGSAFTTSTLNVSGGFDTFFTFRIGSDDTAGFNGADGLTFTIQDAASGPNALGDAGGYMGLGGANPIAPSYSVVFDTFQNDYTEPSNNYIGLISNGNLQDGVSHIANADLTGNPSLSLRDENLVYTWIDYSGGILSVYASENGLKPATPLLSQSIDLSGFTNAYLGFTAGTGSGTANFDILNWDLNTNGIAYTDVAGAPFTDIHANGIDGANWNDSGAWQENTVPTLVNNVYLSDGSSGPYTLNVTDHEQAQSLHLTGSPGNEAALLITGSGAELDVASALEVQAGNTLTADSGGMFVGAPGLRVSNAGTIQATNGGSVFFDANSYIDQTVGGSGLLLSDGPGSSISFADDTVVYGGTLRASNGGSIFATGGYLTYDTLYYDAYLDVEAGLTLIIHGPTTVTGAALVEGQNALLSVQDGAYLTVTPDGGATWNEVDVQTDASGNGGSMLVTGSTAEMGTLNINGSGANVQVQQENGASSTLIVHGDLNVLNNGSLYLLDNYSTLNVDGTLNIQPSAYFGAYQATISVGDLNLDPGASDITLNEINLYYTGTQFVIDPDNVGTYGVMLSDPSGIGTITVDGNSADNNKLQSLHVDYGTLYVGNNSNGDAATLNVINGAWVSANEIIVGANGAQGTINVQAGGSNLTAWDSLEVAATGMVNVMGNLGDAHLAVFNTLQVDANGSLIASQASVSAGHLALDPAANVKFTEVDFSLTNDDFYVDSNLGTAPQVFADDPVNAPGTITVDGNYSDSYALHGLHVDNNTLYIGTNGTGTLNIINGGGVSAYDIVVGDNGTLNSTNGNIALGSFDGLTNSTGTIEIVESDITADGTDFVVDPSYGTDPALFAYGDEPNHTDPGYVVVDGNAGGSHVLHTLSVINAGTLYIGYGGGASTLNVINGGSVFAQNSSIGQFGDNALLEIGTGGIAQLNNLYAGSTATLQVDDANSTLIVTGSSELDYGSVVNSQGTVIFGHNGQDSEIDVYGTFDSALTVVDVNDPSGSNSGYVSFNPGAQVGQNISGDLQVNSGTLYIQTQNTVNFTNLYVGEVVLDPNNPPNSTLVVNSGTAVNLQGQFVIGDAPSSNAQFFLDGSGTVLTTGLDSSMIGDTIFGRYGNVFSMITSGGLLVTSGTSNGYVGAESGSNAYLVISGLDPNYPSGLNPRAEWSVGGDLFIGNAAGAGGQIDVGSAGLLDVAGNIHLGANGNGQAILNVFGYDDNDSLPATVHTGGDMIVGDSGSGNIILHIFDQNHNGHGGGQVITDGNGIIGYNAGSGGTATVEDYDAGTGTPSTWTIHQDLYVGDSGNGQLNIGASPDGAQPNGGQVTVAGNVHVGSDYSSTGTINLFGINAATGLRATLQIGGDLNVGENGTGVVNIGVDFGSGYSDDALAQQGGGLVTVGGNLVIAGSSNSEVGIRFTDPNSGTPSELDVTGTATVNNGVLSLYSGGRMNSASAFLGTDPATFGTAWVSTNSTWNITGDLYVGVLGQGFLSSWAGSTIHATGALFLGSNNDGAGNQGTGTLEVSNIGGSTPSVLNVDLFTEVGDFGHGTLNIYSHGQVTTPFLAAAFGSGATGTVAVTGAAPN